jgi:hypothetical protein
MHRGDAAAINEDDDENDKEDDNDDNRSFDNQSFSQH